MTGESRFKTFSEEVKFELVSSLYPFLSSYSRSKVLVCAEIGPRWSFTGRSISASAIWHNVNRFSLTPLSATSHSLIGRG